MVALCFGWQQAAFSEQNTIIRECKDKGLITLVAAPGQKREKRICLTAQGKEYARQALKQVYEAEEEALRETMQTCSARFVEDFEAFAAHIKKAFDEHMPDWSRAIL